MMIWYNNTHRHSGIAMLTPVMFITDSPIACPPRGTT